MIFILLSGVMGTSIAYKFKMAGCSGALIVGYHSNPDRFGTLLEDWFCQMAWEFE